MFATFNELLGILSAYIISLGNISKRSSLAFFTVKLCEQFGAMNTCETEIFTNGINHISSIITNEQ